MNGTVAGGACRHEVSNIIQLLPDAGGAVMNLRRNAQTSPPIDLAFPIRPKEISPQLPIFSQLLLPPLGLFLEGGATLGGGGRAFQKVAV